jgi:hypothetical protein
VAVVAVRDERRCVPLRRVDMVDMFFKVRWLPGQWPVYAHVHNAFFYSHPPYPPKERIGR